MNIRFRLLIVVSLFICYAAMNPDCQISAQDVWITLRGKIVSDDSNGLQHPVSRASVVLLKRDDSRPVGSGITNEDGVFYIPHVSPGDYNLEVYLLKRLVRRTDNIEIPSDFSRFTSDRQNPSLRYFNIPPLSVTP